MQVQINSDNNISMHGKLSDSIGAYINNLLQRFDPYLTRVEVHLTGERSRNPARRINAVYWKPAPNVVNPSSSPTNPRISRTPSPVQPPKCTDNSKPLTAASRTSVAANNRWRDASPGCAPPLLRNRENLSLFSAQKQRVKPRNHLTHYPPTTSAWHLSYAQSAIIKTEQ